MSFRDRKIVSSHPGVSTRVPERVVITSGRCDVNRVTGVVLRISRHGHHPQSLVYGAI